MKTTSVGVENLCVPCHAACRYCLLSSCGKANGVDYERGKKFAERLRAELSILAPSIKTYYYIGYCMDTPYLEDYIRYSQQTDGPSAQFLQMNGLRIRGERDTAQLIEDLCRYGIQEIDLTIYGTEEYHDRFAGRTGDYAFLLRIMKAAKERGLSIRVSVPVYKENLNQVERLPELLQRDDLSLFLPHGKGRGRSMEKLRLTAEDRAGSAPWIQTALGAYRTEGEWLSVTPLFSPEHRTVTLALNPDNILELESMDAETILKFLEDLDDYYYSVLPSAETLADRYGNLQGKKLYRRERDLYLEWQRNYIKDEGLSIWDMNDETHHFSVRY